MKFLLVAINAKYIHSNLGIYSLKAYAEKELRKKKKAALAGTGKLVSSVAEAGAQGAEWEADGAVVTETQSVAGVSSGQVQVEIAEYTINHQMDQILQDIYRRKPDVIGFFLLYLEHPVYSAIFKRYSESTARCKDLDGRSGGVLPGGELLERRADSYGSDGWGRRGNAG